MLFKYFASKNQLPGLSIGGTVENGLTAEDKTPVFYFRSSYIPSKSHKQLLEVILKISYCKIWEILKKASEMESFLSISADSTSESLYQMFPQEFSFFP